MRLHRLLILAAWALLALTTSVFAQTDPCTSSATTTVYGPTKAHVRLDNFATLLPGSTTPEFSEVQLGIFASGVSPNTGAPLMSITVTRAQLTLVAGSLNCYLATPAELLALPIGSLQFAAAKVRRLVPDVAESAWSANSNPFAKPAALSVPPAVRITR